MTISRLSYQAGAYPSKGSYGPSELKKQQLDRLESLFEVDGDEPASQVSLSYSRLPDGSALISHVTGRTAHALYLDRGVAQLNGLLPLQLWWSPVWDDWDDTAQSAPQSGPRPKTRELIDYARGMKRAADGRLERFLADVRALFSPTPGRQIVVIADGSGDVVRLIQLACASLPPELAARLTFNTRCTDPHTAFQQIVGAQPRTATTFTEAEARHQYRVHNLLGTGVESPAAEKPDQWAQKLAAKWFDDGVTQQEAINLWIPPHADIAAPPKTSQPPTVTPPKQHQAPQQHDEQHQQQQQHQDHQDHQDDQKREPAAAGHFAALVVDPLAQAGSWQLPTRTADPKPLFDALQSRRASENAAQILTQFADVDLGPIPAEVARGLGARLRSEPEFIAACETGLAALQDDRLLAEAFRDLDSTAKGEPYGVLNGPGFQAMAKGPLRDRIPADCGRLRFLIHAVRAQLSDPDSALGLARPAGLDPVAGARAILRILRAARLDPDHGEGSTLATVLKLYWRQPAVVPAYAAVELTADIRKNQRRISDSEALDRLADAVLMATSVNDDVIDLADWLLAFPLSPLQEGALSVLAVAARFEEEQAAAEVRARLGDMISLLRNGDGVRRSEAVTRWWIDRTIAALFRSPAEELWIDAVPELAVCNHQKLLRYYRERVCAPGGQIEALAQDPEVLNRADAAWHNAPNASGYWMTTRNELSGWVDQTRKKNQKSRGRNRAAAKPDGTR